MEHSSGAVHYTWRAGDDAQSVADRLGVTADEVYAAMGDVDISGVEPGYDLRIEGGVAACPEGKLHTVRRGESISSIALLRGVTVLGIAEVNPYADLARLYEGQVLCLPEGAVPPPDARGYMVRYGDAYADILIRHDISHFEFRAANPLFDADRPLPGQRYVVPGPGGEGERGVDEYLIPGGGSLRQAARDLGIPAGRLLRLNPSMAPSDFTGGRVIIVNDTNDRE